MIPRPALLLGWAGVIPFAALVAALRLNWATPVDTPVALLAYGAVILSFMGGAQWGITVRSGGGFDQAWRGYAVSVLPALLAWSAILAGGRASLLIEATAFAALIGYDLRTVREGLAPRWYGRLRVQLTAAVVALLLVAAV